MDTDFKKINIDSLNFRSEQSSRYRTKKGNFFKRLKAFFVLASVVLVVVILWSFVHSGSSVFKYVYSTVTQQNPLRNTDGRVNVLLLGNAGGRHQGAQLTDSIIVASYHLKSDKVTMFSIPRDLWVDSVKAKVNTLWGEGEQRPEGGLRFAKEEIGKILGIPIHYGVRVNFEGFEKAIDIVSGIDVDVPKTFDDYNYPLEGKEEDLCGLSEKELELDEGKIKEIDPENKLSLKPGKQKLIVRPDDKVATESADFACRFEHIHFNKGKTHMDGETALKFVRSRMGTNGEGSDFARSRRQQAVIQAFRDKALSLETLFNPSKVSGLISTFGQTFETDIEKERFLDFYNLLKKMKGSTNVVLGDLGGGKSVFEVGLASTYRGYVLVLPDGNYQTIHDFVKQKLEDDDFLKKDD